MSEIKETEKVTNKLNEGAETNVLKGKLDDNCKREYSREDLNNEKTEKGKEERSRKDLNDKETEKGKEEFSHEDLKGKNKDSETNEFKEKLDDYCKKQRSHEGFEGKGYSEKNSKSNPEGNPKDNNDLNNKVYEKSKVSMESSEQNSLENKQSSENNNEYRENNKESKFKHNEEHSLEIGKETGYSPEELSQAANEIDRQELTKAGRALQKHGSREGSAFPEAKGNPDAINKQGQEIVDDILTDPNSVVTTRHHFRFGDIKEIRSPDGSGIRYDSNGKFIGFLEPDSPQDLKK